MSNVNQHYCQHTTHRRHHQFIMSTDRKVARRRRPGKREEHGWGSPAKQQPNVESRHCAATDLELGAKRYHHLQKPHKKAEKAKQQTRKGQDAVKSEADASLTMDVPTGVCLKAVYLRERGYKNVYEWSKVEGHVMVTRPQRFFVTDPITQQRSVFVYDGSPWENPFKLKDYTLDESLALYDRHLDDLLHDEENLRSLKRLMCEATELGCFCLPGSKCHREVIINKMRILAQKLTDRTDAQR